jgi:hypothetical protein
MTWLECTTWIEPSSKDSGPARSAWLTSTPLPARLLGDLVTELEAQDAVDAGAAADLHGEASVAAAEVQQDATGPRQQRVADLPAVGGLGRPEEPLAYGHRGHCSARL